MGEIATAPQLLHGTNLDVDTTAELLTSVSTLLRQGITIKSNLENASGEYVYVGGAGVTANGSETDGFPLAPGESITLLVDQPNRVWVIATVANQIVHWGGM